MSANTSASSEWSINWHTYDGVRIGFEITASPHGSTLPICETRHFRPGWSVTWTPEELERHASLIAAAPKLLEELKVRESDIAILVAEIRFLEECLGEGLDVEDAALVHQIEHYEPAKAAIAKAEGNL